MGLRRYTLGYGEPKCKAEEFVNTWMNKHNESVDGLHYHEFLVTGMHNPQNYIAKNTSDKYMVKIRLFHMEQYFHTIEYKVPSEYCLDNIYRSENTTGKAPMLFPWFT